MFTYNCLNPISDKGLDLFSTDYKATDNFADADAVPADLWVAGIPENTPYTGKAITYPDFRVYKGKTLLEYNKDYTVRYTNNKNAGTAKVTVSSKDGSNYKFTDVEKAFTINPKAVTITGFTIADKYYDGTKNATVNGDITLDGVLPSDTAVALSGTPVFAFTDKKADTGKAVNVSNFSALSLTGENSNNYKCIPLSHIPDSYIINR